MHPDDLTSRALDALRWVADSAVDTGEGLTWPETRAPGADRYDDLYAGTAGVLLAFAEARLSGVDAFDDVARGARDRLLRLRPEPPARGGLHAGAGGYVVALHAWGLAADDPVATEGAGDLARAIAADPRGEDDNRDLISGTAGVVLALVGDDRPEVRAAVGTAADALVAAGEPVGDGLRWLMLPDTPREMPNLSHGTAGVALALAAAGAALDRPDLLDAARAGGRRLRALGDRGDGTFAAPPLVPIKPADYQHYGWCHGPTGDARLFALLDRVDPDGGWGADVDACWRAVLASGLPARRYPGFWDNLGRCCGTGGVGVFALDRYRVSGDPAVLAWADTLVDDVLARATVDAAGTRWSHTEHRVDPPELEPTVGWMQGAAGIAGWLLRHARTQRDGPTAAVLPEPDRPEPARRGPDESPPAGRGPAGPDGKVSRHADADS